jgi:hypothetical protein
VTGQEGDVASHEAEERALFETDGTALYGEIVAAGGLAATDPRLAEGGELRPAIDLLERLGLARLSTDGETWEAEDPATAQSRIVGPLSTEGARLLTESADWTAAFTGVAQAWRRAPQRGTSDQFLYLRHPEINPYIGGLMNECEEEVLVAQPQALRDPRAIPQAVLRDTALLERGARVRTLYQHSARRSAITRKYVATITERGAQVRTLDEFFNRMIVIDRRVALIPSKDDDKVALVIREPSAVAYLVDIFERAWERGRLFTSQESTTMRDIASEQRAMTLRMLIEGYSDPVSAKRLGVSPRTYAAYVADLKDEFEAETRFQLGYELGRLHQSGGSEEGPASED